MVGAGVVQINLLVDVWLGSYLPEASISYLNYADRVNQFPLGIIGVAMGLHCFLSSQNKSDKAK